MTISHPRRLTPPAEPGALLKRFAAPAPRRPTPDADRDYLALVRQCPCLHCGMVPSEAAHVRMASAAYGKSSGMAQKPADRWALPLCAEHHRLSRHAQHNRGEQQFWIDLGINPLLACANLYAQRGDLTAMQAVVIATIATRG